MQSDGPIEPHHALQGTSTHANYVSRQRPLTAVVMAAFKLWVSVTKCRSKGVMSCASCQLPGNRVR